MQMKLIFFWGGGADKFVLKCNHGCAYNIICENKNVLDKQATIKQLNKWLKEDFGAFNLELHYSKIEPRRIICEEYLGKNLIDYKFFCFDGIPKFVYISEGLIHDRQAKIGFYNLDGRKMEIQYSHYADLDNIKFSSAFDAMLKDAKTLSKDFKFVRVDFFLVEERYYFAELTFTPGGGMMKIFPERIDYEWGKLLNINDLIEGKSGNKRNGNRKSI